MPYPLLSEYIESIKSPADYFDQLKHLRPVLEDDGSPVMTGGNFAKVFKMKDEETGMCYAVKCFLRDQERRSESYRLISEQLKDVDSPYLTSIKYLENEIYVDTKASQDREFPVLLMDWVEGKTLDTYIREHIDDRNELSSLTFRFSRMAKWLLSQPFAHGDLKQDNILVKGDGSLVLVDYDGMYVPAMKGQLARELGSPDFRHPLRTEKTFNEHIDDFPVVSILLSLKAIEIKPSLLEQYGESDRLLFSEHDYRDLSHCNLIKELYSLNDNELITLCGVFTIALKKLDISLLSTELLNIENKRSLDITASSTIVTRDDINNSWVDECGVRYSTDRKRLLKATRWFVDGSYSIKEGTQIICDNAFAGSGIETIIIPNSVTCIGETIFGSKSLVSSIYIPESVISIKKNSFDFDRIYNDDFDKFVSHGLKTIIINENNPVYDSRNHCNAIIETSSDTLIKGCANTIIPQSIKKIEDSAFEGCDELESIVIPKSVEIIGAAAFGCCRDLKSVLIKNGVKTIGRKAFCSCSNLTSFLIPPSVSKIEPGIFAECEKLNRIVVSDANSIYDSRNCCNAIIETFSDTLIAGCGATVIPNDVETIGCLAFNGCPFKTIAIPENVSCIQESAFASCSKLESISLPSNVTYIGDNCFSHCFFKSILIPSSVTFIGKAVFSYCRDIERIKVDINNPVYDSRDNCNAIVETSTNTLIAGCEETMIPTSVQTIGESAFKGLFNGWGYGAYSISIPNGVTEIKDSAFQGCFLRSISIPSSLDRIGNNNFNGNNPKWFFIPINTKDKFEALLPEHKQCLIELSSDSPLVGFGGHKYVDLGLSVKWATCNVGTKKPEGSGAYFAWGECKTKSSYSHDNYIHMQIKPYLIKKYDYESFRYSWEKAVDNKKTLDLEDDVAHQKWGGNWRMPTRDEQKELIENCTWIWLCLEHSNIWGYLVISNVPGYIGQHIFLPKAGLRKETYGTGSDGCYWSSSLAGISCNALYLDFVSEGNDYREDIRISSEHRSLGLSVRPVCK